MLGVYGGLGFVSGFGRRVGGLSLIILAVVIILWCLVFVLLVVF